MKLSLAVGGILSLQTLLPVVSWEAKVLSNTKLDTDDPRSCEEPPVFRGGSHLISRYRDKDTLYANVYRTRYD